MNNFLKKLTGIAVSTGLLLTGLTFPATADTDLGSYDFDSMTQEDLNARGNWIGVFNRNGSQQWQINADIKKGDSGASLYLPSDFGANIWYNQGENNGTGIYETSFDFYLKTVSKEINFDFMGDAPFAACKIKINDGGVIWTPDGKTSPVSAETWYNLKIVFDTNTHMVYTYFDGKLMYSASFSEDTVPRLNTGICNAYIDNLRVYKLDSFEPVTEKDDVSVTSENFDSMTQESLTAQGNWIGVLNRAGDKKWEIRNDVKKGDDGASLYLPSDFEGNIWLNQGSVDGTGLYEISFDTYLNSVPGDMSFDYATPEREFVGGIKIKEDGIWTPDNRTVPTELKKWYNLRLCIDTNRSIQTAFLDGELIYKGALNKAPLARLNITLKDAYIDNFSVTQKNEKPQLQIQAFENGGDISVKNMHNSVAVGAAYYPLTSSIKIETSADGVLNWVPVYEGVAENGIMEAMVYSEGYVRAAAYCGDLLLAVSEPAETSGLKFTENTRLSLGYYKAASKAGGGTWGDYNAEMLYNPETIGAVNAGAQMETNTGAIVGAKGVDTMTAQHGEAVLLTAQGGVSDARFDPMCAYEFGMLKSGYDSAGGTHAEKTAGRYIIMSADVMCPDFDGAKYIFSNMYNSDGVRWSQKGCCVISAYSDDDSEHGSLTVMGDKNVKSEMSLEKNTWYKVTNVIDLKESKSYVFVNSEFAVSASFKQAIPELFNVNRVVVQVSQSGLGEGTESKLYFDNFLISSVTVPYTENLGVKDFKAFINGVETPDAAAGELSFKTVMKNDGSDQNVRFIAVIYSDSSMTKIKSVKVLSEDFDGVFEKTADIKAGTISEGETAKIYAFGDFGALAPALYTNTLK